MKFVAFDYETTGLDTNTCEVIEAGMALYDTSLGLAPMLTRSFFVHPNEPISKEITQITGITQEMVNRFGVQADEATFEMYKLCNDHSVDFILGHNIFDYDVPIFNRYLELAGLKMEVPKIVDTMIDLIYERPPKASSLIYLAASEGKFVNPFPHRALFDALSSAKLFLDQHFQNIWDIASVSRICEIRADVSFNNRHLASQAGYRWDGDRKIWQKKIRKYNLSKESVGKPFPVLVVREF